MAALIVTAATSSPARALPVVDVWAVSGTVVSSSGVPLVGATVENGFATALTDETGRYRFSGLLPGSYTLRASAACHRSESEQVDVLLPGETQQDFTLPFVCTSVEVELDE